MANNASKTRNTKPSLENPPKDSLKDSPKYSQGTPKDPPDPPKKNPPENLKRGDSGSNHAKRDRPKDRPWLIRTYSGHSSATASNALYRSNLAKGQTGLSVAFDLPTQTGYDSDHPLARGEVGRVGVPIGHLDDMRCLFDRIPIEKMNTSMTINATAPWLLALYVALAKERGISPRGLSGTTQNDIIKEYLSRGTYIFPPDDSLRLTSDVIAFTTANMPKWNPINICSYHLQEAGATPVQELAFALAGAKVVLDKVRDCGQVAKADFPMVVGRISFFVNAGTQLITELCKMRAFVDLWDDITRHDYGVEDDRYRRFRYGMQVNSLGLTEQQPENNVYRILLSMLPVVLSKKARARAVQLPAWNEALGLPRPWDQQWSLRLQQIVAIESDILDYGDIFAGSAVIEERTEALKREAMDQLRHIGKIGGVIAAVEQGYMKHQLVMSNTKRLKAIEAGDKQIVGVNCYQDGLPSPLLDAPDGGILETDAGAEKEQVAKLQEFRAKRDAQAVKASLKRLAADTKSGANIMPASIACAEAGVTTGEWADVMRRVFGEYRAPTGVAMVGVAEKRDSTDQDKDPWAGLHARMDALAAKLGRRPKILIGKPGLDGHSNGAEQIAVRARDAGFEVVYEGIRLTPARIASTALEESVHLVGLSILSGSHIALAGEVMERMKADGIGHIPIIVGGIIPGRDIALLKKMGVAAVYTPKDFSVESIMADMIGVIMSHHGDNGAKDGGAESRRSAKASGPDRTKIAE